LIKAKVKNSYKILIQGKEDTYYIIVTFLDLDFMHVKFEVTLKIVLKSAVFIRE